MMICWGLSLFKGTYFEHQSCRFVYVTFYFFILDHFQAIYEIKLNSHTKSYKSHPKRVACGLIYKFKCTSTKIVLFCFVSFYFALFVCLFVCFFVYCRSVSMQALSTLVAQKLQVLLFWMEMWQLSMEKWIRSTIKGEELWGYFLFSGYHIIICISVANCTGMSQVRQS